VNRSQKIWHLILLVAINLICINSIIYSYNQDRGVIAHWNQSIADLTINRQDTANTKPLYEDEGLQSEYPMGYFPTQLQDSIYFQAKRLKIPVSVRLHNDLKRFSDNYNVIQNFGKGNSWQIVLDNLALRPDILAPSPVEIVNRQVMIDNAFYVPFLPNRINSGFSISPQQIGIFLGILEDVSPEIKFDLDYTEEVEIVIYSLQATVVANIFKGIRNPGTHKFIWNLRDDRGRPMPSGDYIAEVRIGKSKFYRKRINIP
jgi:hypothetical protein